MKITFVKKIKTDGSPCRKCADIQGRLEQAGLMNRIDHIAIADERDQESEGMQLAEQFQLTQAPFFLVERDDAEPEIYTVYFKFVNEVLNQKTNDNEAAKDILDANPDLDFL